jgi:aryl-alcohol dehydrogenase-like predicted oxidoreductase
VRFLAVSTHQRPLVPVLARVPDIDVLHVRYNAIHRGAERDVFPHLAAAGHPGIVAFTATSWRQLLDPRRVPTGERVPTAADCYRFVLSGPAVNVCMSGPAKAEHVDDVMAAIERGPMSDEELAWMRRVGDAARR